MRLICGGDFNNTCAGVAEAAETAYLLLEHLIANADPGRRT
jgi:hypothetical protein